MTRPAVGIGARIREERRRQRLSQDELASRLPRPRTKQWMSKIETSTNGLSVATLLEIADALHIPASWLLERAERAEGSVAAAGKLAVL
jgi:transcriptional regulator with XRE-family HTH domain